MTNGGGRREQGPFWALRRRLRATDDLGSAQLVTFIVGAAVFLVATTQLVHFVVHPPGAGGDSMTHEDLKARGSSVLQVLLGSSGFPSSWSTDATGVDHVKRLGLLQDGATLRLDPAKFDALARGSSSIKDPQNGFVDYEEAKIALGLEGFDFHIRANPVFNTFASGTYGMDDMGGFRVGYVGHWTGVNPSDTATAERADLATLADASDGGLVYHDTLRSAADHSGDVYTDKSNDLRSFLVPNLGTSPVSTVRPAGDANTFHVVEPSAYESNFAPAVRGSLTSALALTDGNAQSPTLGYSDNKEVRVTLGVANMSTLGVAPLTISWNEFVSTGDDSGDYGVVEVSPDNGQSWTILNTDPLLYSQDTPTSPQTPADGWAARTLPITSALCGACAGNDNVLVAFRWVANSAGSGAGWIIDDVSISLESDTGFHKDFESPVYGALIIGSDVAQGALTAIEVRNALRDYVNLHNGRIVVLGSSEQTMSWLTPLMHVGIADAAGGVATPDATNPLLTVPNELAWQNYPTGERSWDVSGPEASGLFNVVLGDSHTAAILASTKSGAFGDHTPDAGNVVLAAFQPTALSADEALRFLANAIAFGKYHYLYMDAGPAVPEGVTVAALTRTATMDKSGDGSGDFAEMTITLYVWPGVVGSTTGAIQSWGTPMGSPSPPRALAVGAANGLNVLTWDAPTSPDPLDAIGYRVYRSTSSGEEAYVATHLVDTDPPLLRWDDENVTNGVTYYYNVTAYNAKGSSTTSNEASGTPSTLPSVPQGLVATGGVGAVALSWTAPTSSGGMTITTYEIYRSTPTAGNFQLFATTAGSNSSFNDLNVQPNQDHYYKLRALTAVGASPYTAQVQAQPVTLPTAPVLTATGGAGEIVLTWTVPADGGTDLTGYHIYAGASGAETSLTWVNSTQGSTVAYTESVTPGSSRYYRVAAISTGAGEGPQSTEKQATSIPPAPLTLQVTQTSVNQTELAWTPPVDGDQYTGFDVYGGDSEGDEALIAHVGQATTTYTDTGLHWDEFRSYIVYATMGGVQSAPAHDTITTWGVPGAPTLTATGGAASMVLTWTTPDPTLTPLTGYHIYAGATSGSETSLVWVNSTNGATVLYTHSGLGAGTQRFYQIAAISAAGEGPRSGEVNNTTIALPNAPGTVAVSETVAGTLHLSWSAPGAGTTPTSYRIYGGDTLGVYTLLYDTLATNTSYDDAGLGNGHARYYQVKTVGGSGESTTGSLGSGTTWSLPSTPGNFAATGGVRSIVLTWTAPTDGGTALTGYHIYASDSTGAESSFVWVNSSAGSTVTYTESSLTNGQTRFYKIAAITGVGESTPSSEATATTVLIPGAPATLTVSETVPGTLHLSWGAPLTGTPTHYAVYGGNSAGSETFLYNTTTTNTTYDNAGLSNGQPRSYKVTAWSNAGEGSAVSGTATTWNTPDAVTVTATGGVASIVLTWSAPANNGAALTGYHIYASDSSAHEASLSWVNSTNGATTTFTESGLSNGQTRYYKVTAINAVGESGLSDEKSAATVSLPGTPGALTITETVAGTLNLSWSAPATGGTPTSYNVYRGTTLGVYTLIYSTSTTNTTYSDVGLGNGATRYYQVMAVNGAGESAVGTLGSATTWTTPGAPVVVGVAASSHHVALTITAPASNGGTSITDYYIYYCQGIGCTPATPYSTSNQLTYTDTHGTALGQTWRFKVSAINAVGEGTASAIISVVTT